ncbi:MAG: hypothetical protein AAF591_12250 [Verrucomicrobiota bacterium]
MRALRLIRRKQIGGILLALYRQGDGTYYVEAESDEFRVWRLTRDAAIAKEYFQRYWFWGWLIEAIPSGMFLGMAIWFMRR